MCQSNLLPTYTQTEQEPCCSPENWTSWLTKREKTKNNPILNEILSRCTRAGKSSWINRCGVIKHSVVMSWQHTTFIKHVSSVTHPESHSQSFKQLCQRNKQIHSSRVSLVHAWECIYHWILSTTRGNNTVSTNQMLKAVAAVRCTCLKVKHYGCSGCCLI